MTLRAANSTDNCTSRKEAPRSGKRRYRLIGKLLLLVISFGVSILLAEGVLRVAAPQPKSWLDLYQSNVGSRSYGLQPNAQRVVATGEATWTITTDERGFRKFKGRTLPSAAPIALVLGDSFTFGEGVSDDDTLVARLAARDDIPFRFFNAGVGGYGPVQYRSVLEDWLAGRHPCPQVTIIVIFTGNDFHDCVWSKDTPVVNGVLGDTGGLRSWLKRNTHLYRGVSKVRQSTGLGGVDQRAAEYRSLMNKPEQWAKPPLSDAWPIFCTEIERIAETCRANGGNVLGVIIPSRDLVELPEGSVSHPVERAARAFTAADVQYADTTAALRRLGATSAYLRYNGHLTPAGNAAVADTITPQLRKLAASSTGTQAP